MKANYILLIIICCLLHACNKPQPQQQSESVESIKEANKETTQEELIIKSIEEQNDFQPRTIVDYSFICEEEHGMNGLLIKYELAIDKEGLKDDYPTQGIRLYEKLGDDYAFVFDNPNAWMCMGCNNSLNTWMNTENAQLNIAMTWGPRQSTSSTYIFEYDKKNKHWYLIECNDRKIKPDSVILLQDFDAESTEYNKEMYEKMYENINSFYISVANWGNGIELERQEYTSAFDHSLSVRQEEIDELLDKMDEEDYVDAFKCAPILQEGGNYLGRYILQQLIDRFPDNEQTTKAQSLLEQYEKEQTLNNDDE